MSARVRFAQAGLITAPVGFVAAQVPLDHAQPAGWGALVAGVGMVGGAGWSWYNGRRSTTSHINRWTRRSRRNQGVQSYRGHLKETSSWAMRRQATALRPSLANRPRAQRWLTPVSEYATLLGKSGSRTLWLSHERHVVRIAGARSGKTAAMGCRIVDHPGPALVTSTKADLYTDTAPLRARRGPVHVFNPTGEAGIASTLKWSPLVGCTSISTAKRRAVDLIPTGGTTDREEWNQHARRILAPMLVAAAQGGQTMGTVHRWVSAHGEDAVKAAKRIQFLLKEVPESAGLIEDIRQFFGMTGENEKTRTSITSTLMPALSWLSDPVAAAIGDAPLSDDLLDVNDLLDSNGTVYIIGGDQTADAYRLTGALVAEIAYQAPKRAGHLPRGRLDPALLMSLDEAALVAPGPVPRWTCDMGGRGIVLDIAAQSLAPMETAWGRDGVRTILNNAVVLLGAGCLDPDDIAHWEALTDTREEIVETKNADGKVVSTSTRTVPVLSRGRISQLPSFHAVIFGRGPISIIQTPALFKRRDAKRAKKRAGVPVQQTRYAEKLADNTEEVTQ
ncbi:type IV secretory system conjugative DNA transfer family protein [Micromonospora zamorensis]|uniref:type IV secretory system conjugative DNA transfer family protein n=1 Tax=Micromonospora zamorensis TaxID=709883 RepID=UPI0037A27CCB